MVLGACGSAQLPDETDETDDSAHLVSKRTFQRRAHKSHERIQVSARVADDSEPGDVIVIWRKSSWDEGDSLKLQRIVSSRRCTR